MTRWLKRCLTRWCVWTQVVNEVVGLDQVVNEVVNELPGVDQVLNE